MQGFAAVIIGAISTLFFFVEGQEHICRVRRGSMLEMTALFSRSVDIIGRESFCFEHRCLGDMLARPFHHIALLEVS
jgi:hypothetical protein